MKVSLKSPGVKLALITTISLLLLIPAALILEVIVERGIREQNVVQEVASQWGDAQAISGPILATKGTLLQTSEGKAQKTDAEDRFLLPDVLDIDCNVKTESRKRSIFKVPVYTSDIAIEGVFPAYSVDEIWHSENPVELTKVQLAFYLSDNSGFIGKPRVIINGQEYEAHPGIPFDELVSVPQKTTTVRGGLKGDIIRSRVGGVKEGFHVELNPGILASEMTYRIELKLRGTRELHAVPIGKESSFKMTSDWPHPSFTGTFVPQTHEISENGFTAEWNAGEMNRSFPQILGGSQNISNADFGVSFIQPVNHYGKVDRAVKYAILVIGLTFLSFFIGEIMLKCRIHPIQYLLVGFSLILFYLLLLALSEHIGFGLSYLISAAATVASIGLYSLGALRRNAFALLISIILSVVYGLLYILMNLEENALLVGSIALFVILTIIMFLTRKIDWYNMGNQES